MTTKEMPREMINARYVAAIEFLINNFRLKNQRDFSGRMQEAPTVLSQIKSGHRNASITQLAKLVNDFDLNANFFFRAGNDNEPVEYANLNINPNITGNNKDVTVGKSVAKNDGVVHGNFYNVENIINESSPEIQNLIRELQGKYETLEKEKDRFKDEVSELKKIITSLNTQIQESNAQIKEKDDRLYQAQCELIEVYKKQKN